MTTFAEIHAARIALDAQLDAPIILPFVAEPPAWQQVNVRHRADDTQQSAGIMFQQCGGGRRIIKKKVAGGNY